MNKENVISTFKEKSQIIIFIVLVVVGVAQSLGQVFRWTDVIRFSKMTMMSPAPAPLSRGIFDYLSKDYSLDISFHLKTFQTLNVRYDQKIDLTGPHRVKIPFLLPNFFYTNYRDSISKNALKYLFCENGFNVLDQLKIPHDVGSAVFTNKDKDKDITYEIKCH